MEGRIPPSQEDTPIQEEVAIMVKGSGSPRLRCLRINSGIRRGSNWSSILYLSLVRKMKSQMSLTRKVVIGIILI